MRNLASHQAFCDSGAAIVIMSGALVAPEPGAVATLVLWIHEKVAAKRSVYRDGSVRLSIEGRV